MKLATVSKVVILFSAFVRAPADPSTEYTVATFNIQNFGRNKVKNAAVLQILELIITRYDLIAIQEVQDKTETGIATLLAAINEGVTGSKKYAYVLSDHVGAARGEKEQYALFYRPNVVSVLRTKHYPDPEKVYSRVPFLTEVHFKKQGIPKFVLVNLHSKPDSSSNKLTVQEIDSLVDVYEYVKMEMGIKNVLFVGDLNAGGQYIRKKDWKTIRLRTDPQFKWLVPDDWDTTIGNSNVAYDRIIVAGEELKNAILPRSTKVFHFDEEFSMDTPEALDVSDHYPVEVKLKTSTRRSSTHG